MGQIEVKETATRKIDYLPCIKCGSENIDFADCGYSSFNVAWGKCKDCGHEVKLNPAPWDITTEKIIRYWNRENDPEVLRKRYQDQIDKLQKLIDELPPKKGGE